MRQLCYGQKGAVKPGMLYGSGAIRDLSAHVNDFAGDVLTGLASLSAITPENRLLVQGDLRPGACTKAPVSNRASRGWASNGRIASTTILARAR